ncbi:HAMP domain-containing histidine kinase [Denitromonas ohlonensis]|uniref:histidine kinase n=3 Tax=Denitromonas TaxID=139331 RepID=A0A557RWB0_9RHOO|nr:HAMP domain-containing histidine kinase [Denitromonas ohlonensis]TVO77549.1 HAMP domain-containing histidine kinase [Denitromonas ohlonensis]
MFSRMSFRQMLLAGFVLIALVLSAAALQGLRVLESFAQQSRAGADTAVGLTSAAQQLAQRTVDMERSARQFVVLNDPALRKRYRDARADAETALLAFSRAEPSTLGGVADTWRAAADEAEVAITGTPDDVALRDALDRLHLINERLSIEARQWIAVRNARLLDTLEANRLRLAWQVLLALLVAVALAAFFGWQLARPVKQIEEGIARLGDNLLEIPVDIEGPADLRQVGQRLDWLRQRLGELESDRARMLRHVSHELKTPLAALREGIALLDDEVTGPLAGGQREVVDILRDNAHLLQGRIEDLLDFNAAVFDARRLQRSTVEVKALLTQVADGQRLQAKSRDVEIELQADPVSVDGDIAKLGVAVGNLLANAISFSASGGVVSLRAARSAGHVHIDCIDTGPGIAEDDVPRIFDPFFQGRRQGATPRCGSGVGLSIVREYVQAHGGRVVLLSGERGAHFRIELPLDS